MPNPKPTFSVGVDPKNPGQFYACCGLLELANCESLGAQGWFDGDTFHVVSRSGLRPLLLSLVANDAKEELVLISEEGVDDSLEIPRIVGRLEISLGDNNTLHLDSWLRVGFDKRQPVVMGNAPWNFWAGQQTSKIIWNTLRDSLKKQLATIPDNELPVLFSHRVLIKGRFGFDPGAAWDALDAGFSPNAQNMPVASSPAVEMLAALGRQRFSPVMQNGRQAFDYATWPTPLPVSLAPCAAATVPIVPGLQRFRGQIISRGQYAALGHSTQLFSGDSHG